MGYYTGDGEIVGGGESTRTLKSFYEWGAFAIRQKIVTSTLRRSGVSLSTAQGTHASDALTAKCASPFLKNVMCSPRTVWGLPKSYVNVMSTFVSATVAASGVIHSRTAHTPISR